MKRVFIIFFSLLGIQLYLLSNIQFTAWPEMFSYPYLRNSGFFLYRDMIQPYPPLLTLFLSVVYSSFGYGLEVLQTTAWSIIALSSFLVFVVLKNLTRSAGVSLLALAVYILVQPFLEGNMLWFDIAIVPPILLGTLFAFRWLESQGSKHWNLVLAGIFFGAAALIKQPAGIFLAFFLGFMILNRTSVRDILYFLAGPVVFIILLLLRLTQQGELWDFRRWTIWYPLGEWGSFPGYVQMSLNTRVMAVLGIFLTPLFVTIIVRRNILNDKVFQLLLLFLAGGLITIYPRFSFFHFQAALAILVIFYGYLTRSLNFERRVVLSFLFLLLLFPIVHRPVLLQDWQKEARFYSQEDLCLANTIRDEIGKNEKVYLLGLHSGLYVIAERFPPKRWTDNFGWYLEIPGVQEEVLSRWEGNPPQAVFWRTPSPGNWFDLGTYQPKVIAQWIEDNYTKEKEVKPGIWIWILRQAQD